MKHDPEDLKELADDLQKAIDSHEDALSGNPDIATELVKVKNKTRERFEQVAERIR